jgi:hypothetical protein
LKTSVIALAVVAIIALIWYFGRREANPAWEVGGLYSVRDSERRFRVVKVLAIDPGVVSIRMYKQTFDQRPSNIDPAKLSLGSINDADGFGIGHLPIDPPTFSSWGPQLLQRSSLTDEELEGYRRMWKESGGGASSSWQRMFRRLDTFTPLRGRERSKKPIHRWFRRGKVAFGEFIRGDRRLLVELFYSLGPVKYYVGALWLEHEPLLRRMPTVVALVTIQAESVCSHLRDRPSASSLKR